MSRLNTSKGRLATFGIGASLVSVIYFFLIFQRRMPVAHDTFQYLEQQYVYFNEITRHHSIPLWFPFVTQGIVGNFHFTSQINLLSPLFYLLGFFFKDINYLYLFYFLLFFEELFFVMGVVLLASVYYKNIKTIIFVSLTLSGATIWYPQVWWNFHLYYFIPIVLYCIHKCIETKLFKYLIFSIMFFLLSVFGNVIYCIIYAGFVVLLYIVFLMILQSANLSKARLFFKKNLRPIFVAGLLGTILIVAISFSSIFYYADQIVYVGSGRGSSERVNLGVFLTYGGSLGIGKYADMFRRYGASIDINLYAGFLILPFILISLLYVRRRLSFVVGSVAFVVFLFSTGTIVSTIFYYFFPFGKFFRHIGLTSTVFKLFIVFYAGFGFERFEKSWHTDKKLVSLALISLAVVGLLFAASYAIRRDYFWFMSDNEETLFFLSPYTLLGAYVYLFYWMLRTKVRSSSPIYILLAFTALDLLLFKYSLIVDRMPRVSKGVISLFRPYRYKFHSVRSHMTSRDIDASDRMRLFYTMNIKPSAFHQYSTYNTIESFFFTDSAVSIYRTDFMLKSLKKYLDIEEEFPSYRNRIYEKYSGIDFPKITVFSKLNVVRDEIEMGKIFRKRSFTGDMLFSTYQDVKKVRNALPRSSIAFLNSAHFMNRNERTKANIIVKKFSFNALHLKVSVKGSHDKSYFLSYADTYHPHWQAYVNGRSVPVVRSNIAYKLLMIPSGVSDVVFQFGDKLEHTAVLATLLLCLVIFILIGYIFLQDLLILQPYENRQLFGDNK